MRLWPHQEEAIRICAEQHQRPRSRVLQQAPPGTGKTEIAVRAALSFLQVRPFGRALIAVPTAPILDQFAQRVSWSTRERFAVEKAERHAPRSARLVLASQASLWGRLDKYARDTLLIFDEAHHANFDAPENLRLVESFDHVLGLSASPWSVGCTALFAGGLHLVLGLEDAQRQGLSPPYELHGWTEPRGPFGLVFCASNAECEARAAAHSGSSWVGINSGEVPERIAAWKAGKLGVLYANRMLCEGFDEPRCCAVWITVESESEIRYVQMAGRALRQAPGKVARLYCESAVIRSRLGEALARCRTSSQARRMTTGIKLELVK